MTESNHVFRITEKVYRMRQSKNFLLFIVFMALLLDNILVTVVVPIIPDFLYEQQAEDREKALQATESGEVYEELYGNYSYSANYTPIEPTVPEIPVEDTVRQESVYIGILFASKAIAQLITNPFVGPLTNRIGYHIPMFTGLIIMFISTLVFAFGESYGVLLTARMVQGIGSSASTVSGMGLLAQRYTDQEERGAAMGIALGGLAFGVLIGPPFGGLMYDFVGKESPFLVIAGLALLNGFLQLSVVDPVREDSNSVMEGTPLLQLLKDPYILIGALTITGGNMAMALLEPSLPMWMIETMNPEKWQLGIIFLPASISYLISTNIFGPYGYRIGRWLCAMLGILITAGAMVLISFSTSIPDIITPNLLLGFAVGMVDSTMLPLMGYLVDIRHVSVYGSVYAIADVAFCIGFAIGPSLSGEVMSIVGFPWMIRGMAVLNIAFAPLCIFLRNPPPTEDKQMILMNEEMPITYVTSKQTDYQAVEGVEK
ncbi:synaptic vesicular amine transporter-like [Antedon mediterranea]|uniref:synaptic vesicular amine transporter-like n=1 Tax=Antedon mediterranea TaxID=105859 RepID=UPI003AF6D949